MKVILNNDVTNLGEEGDICTVAPGYARNFLLPKGLVMEYNARNLAHIEERRAEIEARRAEKRKNAEGLKERLESEALVVSMTAGINGKLFGSVTAATIAEQLTATGIEVERKRIDVPDHSLKAVGNYKIRIKLYADQEAVLTVKVEAANAKELEQKRARLGSRDQAAVASEKVKPEEEVADEGDEGDAEENAVSKDPEVIAMEQAIREEEQGSPDEEDAPTADAATADAAGPETDVELESDAEPAAADPEQDTDDPETK
jgi:large subunit ribosomal protein L9